MANTSGPWDQYKPSSTETPADSEAPWAAYGGPPKTPEKRTLGAVANDTVIEVANAAAGGIASAANFIKPGNAVSGWIDKNIVKAGEDSQSDVTKAAKQQFREEVQNADGVMGELGAVGKYVVQNPLLTAAQAGGSFVGPAVAVKGLGFAGKAAGLGAQGVERAGRAGGAAAGAAMAGGDAAGTAYELSKNAGATEDQAVAAGRQASVIPAVVGGVGGMFGAENLLAGAKGFVGGAVSRALKTGASEALQEGVEEGVTQYEGQRAAMPYDASIDPAKGVAAAAGMGAALGGVTGAGTSLLVGRGPQPGGQEPAPVPVQPPAPGPTLALPAPEQGVIAVGADGTARTPAYQAPGYVGDVTDVQPKVIDPVREQVAAAAEQGGALSTAALTAIDSGTTAALQPPAVEQPEPAPISLEEADARDQAAYEQFFASADAEPVVARYFENDDDIPDFDAASNVSEAGFLRSLGATDENIQDAIATSRQSVSPQGSAAVDAGPQANEPASPREGAAGNEAGQASQVAPGQPGNFTGMPTATMGQAGATARPGPGFGLKDALAQIRTRKQQEASNAQATAPATAPATQAVPAARTGAVEAAGVDQLERERIDNEERIGKPALRSRIAEGREPKYEWNTQEGIYTAKASDAIVGGDVNAYKVKLTLTADEKRAVKRANSAMDLADTPEERAEARKELMAALRPAVDRALAEKTTPAPTDILNPAGQPFKTRMAADRAAKQTPGAVVRAGAMTPEAAQAIASDAKKTGNAADASDAIFNAVDSSVGAAALAGPAPDIKAITAKLIPDMTDAELLVAIEHYGPEHKRTAKLQKEVQRRAAPAATPTQGSPNGPQADQAQQAATQPAQAGAAPAAEPATSDAGTPATAGTPEVRALTDGAPTANPGAQAAPAAGAQAAPAETKEQRTQRIAAAGDEWARMPTVQREALAGRADGLNPIQRKRVPSAAWADLNSTIRGKLADAMGTRAESGGNQAGTIVNTAPVAIKSEADQIAEAVSKADRLDLKGAERAQWVNESLSGVWGMTPDEVRDVPEVAAALRKKPSKEDATAATVRAVEQVVRQAEQAVAADLSLDDQLKRVNDQLANQGQVQNANTRAKRDQIRTAIAERDFPAILKAVDGDVGSAEAINQALQFAGDEPKAKVIERVLKNRGISDEYRQRWADRLMGDEGAQGATLQTAMESAGWAGETGQGDTIWTKRANGERYTALLSPDAGSMEITVLVDAVDTQIASFKVGDAKAAAEAANKAVADDLAESAAPAPSPGVVSVPPAVDAALTADMEKQQSRVKRLRTAASANGTTLDEKKAAVLKVVAAEATLRAMRTKRFDAEDAAVAAVKAGNPGPFSEYADLFPGAEQALVQQLLATPAEPIDVQQVVRGAVSVQKLSKADTDAAAEILKDKEPAAAPAKPATKKKPSADQTRAKADLMAALADLGDILGKNTRMNIMPEQEQKLLPVLTRVLDAAFRLGYAKFKDSAKFALDQIRANLGDEAADALTLDHLQGAYIAMAGGKDGVDTKRAVIDVESKAEIEAHEATTTDDEQEPAAGERTLTQTLRDELAANRMPKDNPALKKLVEAFDGKPADQSRMKQAQEALEAAIVQEARARVEKLDKEGTRTTFNSLVSLYESQPLLNVRTSTSIANQAYSTPAPLAYLASKLAGITPTTRTHEPTGGTGMLLIGVDPKNAVVNELNDLRVSLLKEQGFAPTQKDAAIGPLRDGKGPVDAVITNPPFGSVKGEDGKPIKVKVDGYNIGQIDHLIAAHALDTMKDDGRAVLILGANKAAGGLSTDDRIFMNWLYSHYNVVGHFEVEGDLYVRQGAGWPVRVIVINGREKSAKLSPVAGTIKRVDNWDQVYEQFNQILGSGGQSVRGAGTPAVRSGSGQARPGNLPAPARAEAAGTGGQRPQAGADGAGNVDGARAGTVADRTGSSTDPVGHIPDEQRLNGQSFVPPGLDTARPDPKPAAERPAKPAGAPGVAAAPADTAGNEFQTAYVARSARKDEGVLIPSNMAQPTQDALNRLEDEVGDIDEFARKELGYKSVEALHNALMGLQVDSVATAIHQIKQGKAVVIADQTGIGKGRQAASIIRWAARNGMTPVFVSVKPSLFTDMYGDLADIGTHDVAPFILNSDAWVSGDAGEKLFANKPSSHRAAVQSIVDNGKLPEARNALFMTYSQINTANLQRQALMALAGNAVFVLDESHNAAGASGTGEFMIGALAAAKGVTYLSATYAKRPDNMPLYFKTDIGDAAADSEGLADAMAAGGLPLQTVVSNNLVKAGQMFRRERSYDGVSIASTFDTKNRVLHERLSDEATQALRAIVSADKKFHSIFVKTLDKQLKQEGSQVQDSAGNQVSAGVQHTEFSSVVHNFVRQMLLGLKAQTAADEAVASLKRGEKPIIAVENTMGSFLSEYAAQNGLNQGDSLGAFDYRTVLSRALERSRVIIEVSPTGDKVKKNIPLSKLDPITRKAYDDAQGIIDALVIDIPVSPIDWMRAEIARAGFSVAEITGRDMSVDYSNPRKPVLAAIDLTEQRDKVASTRKFNGGELDALILNVAGSTGISLHASEKFQDQRQRHMIVAQAAGDINIFMQMLGRVHRTGQVRLPKYTILSVDLPTEKRPTAVLSRKMKSLNANTSSNTESATSVKTADILNKYGDQIVNQYLQDNLELARQLNVDDLLSSDGHRVADDIARKATGRLALQPIEVQRAFYEDVEAQYDALIEYLNKTNQNDLEPRTFDFDAKETRQELLFEGPNKATPFGEDAVYGEYSIKAQGAPMKPAEIRAAMAENLGGLEGVAHANKLGNDLLQTYADQINAAREKAGVTQSTFDEDKYATLMKSLYGDAGDGYVQDAKAKIANGIPLAPFTIREVQGLQGVGPGLDFIRSHAIGTTFRVDINSEPYNAVVTNVRSTHKTTGNPFSLSKIQLTVAVNGALRSITVPATQFRSIEVSSIARTFTVESLFKEQPPNQRETAKIVTGNLLAAYGEIKGVRGTIISFTKADGVIEQGILLPKLFDFSKNTQGDYRLRSGADALKFLQQSTNKDIGRFGIATRDGQVRVLPRGDGIQVRVPKSKQQGARYFLDKKLIDVGGDFVSSSNAMVANVDDAASAEKMLDLLIDKQALYALPSMADEAKSMAAPASFSRTPAGLSPEEAVAMLNAERPSLQAMQRRVSDERMAMVQRIVREMSQQWARAPEIIVARNMQDRQIPQAVRDYDQTLKSQGATGEPRGFIYKGKVYLLADELRGPQQIAEVLFHEALGHFGLRGAFGDSLNSILQQMGTMRRRDVVEKAREYGMVSKGMNDADTWAAMSVQDRLSAAEEVLAEMAQSTPEIGFVQRAIAAIRTWLRANVPGFKQLALTDAEIVRSYILPARGFVTRSSETPQQSLERAMMAFSRGPAGGQTETAEFKRWFGDSKVVDGEGKPLVVYHGTGADFSEFSASKIGSAWGADTVGFFFTDSAKTASSYATSGGPTLQRDDGANIIPAYIRISRPVTVEALEAFTGESGLADAYESPIELMDERRDDIMSMLLGNEQDDWSIDKDSKPSVNNTHDGVIFSFGGSTLVVAVDPGQIKSAIGNNGGFDPDDTRINFSRTTAAAKAVGDSLKSITVSNIKQRAGFKATDYLGLGLQALGRRQIVDIYGDMLPMTEYNRLVQQMEADKNEGGAEADQLVTRWAKLPDEGKLADLMHDATLAQIDPAKPYVEGDDKARYMSLQGRFKALSDGAQKAYIDTRDAYQSHHEKVRSAIKERIERSEIKGERKAALLKQMDDDFFKAVKGVYFPLSRFGQYVVTVKAADGKIESVSRAETKAEAEALRSNLLSAFPRDKGFSVGRVMLSKEFVADRDAVGRGFMTELYQVLDKQDMDAEQRAELEDTLGQLYLSSLPDLSWAKHGIHRKGTPGFSQDARRAYAQNMFHGARYLAKLRYSDLMQDELTAMQRHVDDWREVEDFDQNSAQRVVDEMNKRHETLMNPKSNKLSTWATSLGFVFHLGLSPASAMVNLSQTALVAYPIMGAKWGFGKASAALLKASAEAAKGKNDITGSLNEDERAAYDEAVRAGTIDVTMAHDLAGIAQGEDAGVMWKIRPVMRWASFLFHHAERFNRQVTFVAAYRLAREAGTDQKAAFEQATKATYDGHFDYAAANRPRIMQGNVAKVVLLFKQYGQNMVYTLARNAQQAIKAETPEARAQARKTLGGLLATHAAAAGVLGLPMVTTLLAAASMIGGDDDEPWDAKVALQNMLADTFGQKPAEVMSRGLSRLTPWDISSRVGLDKLIFPDVQEGLEGQRLAESAMAAALGPVAGIGINVLKGLQDMADGQYQRGLESMMPAALRGPIKAVRYESEGVQDKTGVVVKDEVSAAGVVGQFLGFSPSEVRNATEGKSAIVQRDRALGERRQELLTKAARATMDKDAEARAEALKEIERFNEKNPGRRITAINIVQSVRNRQKRIDQAEDGVYLPRNRRDAMDAGRFANAD